MSKVMLRKPEEIVQRIRDSKSLFGFENEVFSRYLTFEQLKPLLKPDATSDGWNDTVYTEEQLRKDMAEYMSFAWGKCLSHRGISASRSVEKIGAWLWLLGDEDVLREFNDAPYTNYGAQKLAVACAAYELPIPNSEELRRMMQGLPCEPGCDRGCGR